MKKSIKEESKKKGRPRGSKSIKKTLQIAHIPSRIPTLMQSGPSTYIIGKNQLNQFKKALSLKSQSTQETYFIMNNSFLSFTKCESNRDNIIGFLKKFSKNSIITAFYAIRFLHQATGIPFPITRKDISPTGIKRIKDIMSIEEVEKFIEGANRYFGLIEIGYVCLSTIYAVRRSEIYDLESDDINIDERELTIWVHKSEENNRVHLIPEEIVQPMIELRDGLKRIRSKPHITELNHLFDAICEKSGIELRPRAGFHSIRRRVVSSLVMRHLDPKFINSFIRWKPRTQEMLDYYTTLDTKQVDREIFEKHPFVKLWKPKKVNTYQSDESSEESEQAIND